MKLIKKFESYKSREEMCDYLCNVCGCDMTELDGKSDSELQEMCNELEPKMTSEAKGEKWIQDAIKRPGSLRSKMGKKGEEKISKTEIKDELDKLKSKDKDKSKPGVQGLSKSDLRKFRQLNLAKTLKGLKENQDSNNYMFFANLQTIKRLVDGMLEMEESKVDAILSDGHGWALDHIATSKDDVEEVFNFLASHESEEHNTNHSEPSFEETEGNLANKDLESEMKNIKGFNNF